MNKVLIIDSSEFYHNPQKDFISKELPETEIVYAANTEIAIDSCNAQLPDVVFLDEQIAIADKLQFCKKVKASDNCKDIVIILMISKNSNSEFMKDAIVAGVDSFLQKPFQPIELVSRIQVILKLTNAKRDFKQQNELLEKEVISKNNNFHTTNERFNALLQNSIDGFALVSADGIIEHVNAPFIESLKLNSDNIIDNEIIEIMRSKISETKLGQINEFFKSDNLHYTLNYDFADKYHRLKIRREKSDGGFTFIIRDISFRQNALNQVCSYKRHYKQLFDESMSAIFHIDEESKKIVDANKAAQKLISMPKHQLLNNHFSMILIDSEEQTSMLLKRIAESGKSEFIVSKQLYNSREEKKYCDLLLSYYEIEGKGMLQCTCIDVTQQKMFEQELCGSEERFRVFTDKIPACVYMKNKDGKIVFANKYMRERFLPDDWIGKKVADFFLKEKNEEIEWDDRKIINGEIHNKEEKVKDINGKDYVFASRKFALGDEKYGDLVGGIALDITDSKRARDEVNVMYKIANSILSSADLNTFFPKVREIIHSVIDSTYFYVAIYDEMSDCMKILYQEDQEDEFEILPRFNTLSWKVFDSGKSLLLNENEIANNKEIEFVGQKSKSWLGVCLAHEDKKIGMMAVQSYHNKDQYTEEDLRFFEIIADEVSLAIIHNNYSDRIKKDLKVKELLLQEVHHRVNNNFQIITSFLKMQIRQNIGNECSQILEATKNRVRSMSLVHEKLYTSKDLASIDYRDYINSLVRNLRSTLIADPYSVEFKIEIENVFLDINVAIPCGLIINEIISNSLKFAFPNGKGIISINFEKTEDDKYKLIVADNGIGIPDTVKEGKIGFMVINALTTQLHATMKVDSSSGTRYEIRFGKEMLRSYSVIK